MHPQPDNSTRLLVVDPEHARIAGRSMQDLPELLQRGDVLVVNDAATLPASLPAQTARGASIELRLLGPENAGRFSAIVFGAATGLTWLSTVPPTSGLVALMFGTRWLAMLFGFAFFSHQVGGFLGVWLGGIAYETTGSYNLVWFLSIAFGVTWSNKHDDTGFTRLD